VLVDGIQQNQGTQTYGQGYLGSLKSLIPATSIASDLTRRFEATGLKREY
jgi:hypothetical protein